MLHIKVIEHNRTKEGGSILDFLISEYINYMKCSKCGGHVHFDPKKQGLLCEYCGTFTEIDESKEKIEYAKKEIAENQLSEYKCLNCGATLLTFDDTSVTFCSYCKSSVVVKSKFEQGNNPDLVIPFRINKAECEEIYKKYLKKFSLAPDYLKENATISKFRGIYMPYAVYKMEKHGEQEFKGSKYSHRRGDYDYYNDYIIKSDIDAEYDGIAYDISSRFEDRFSKAIAPFNYNDVKPFDIRYLSGFYADSPDVIKKVYSDDAMLIAKRAASKELLKNKELRRYGCTNAQIPFNISDIKTAYYPVYFLAIEDMNGDICYAVLNGQTGKVVAEIPIDFKKFIRFTMVLAIPIFVLLNIFITLTPLKITWFAMLMSLVNLLFFRIQKKKIKAKEERAEDKGAFFIRSAPLTWNDIEKKKEKMGDKKSKFSLSNLIPYLSIIVPFIILCFNPVEDIYYYIASLVTIIITLRSIFNLVEQHNTLSTRKPRQLEKRGGDDVE